MSHPGVNCPPLTAKFDSRHTHTKRKKRDSHPIRQMSYTQRNLFEILSNEPQIRLYLSFSGWFKTKRMSVWFQINRKMVSTIWFRVHLIRFRKDLSVCRFRLRSFQDHVDLYMLFDSQVIEDLNNTLLLEHPVVGFERKTRLCFEANGEHIKNHIFKI